MNDSLTPMMRQFNELKAKHPDALLLFRCGDFYETYCQDAVEAAQILGITLTRRNNGKSTAPTEMAGFPYHALDNYLPRLIRAGRRVAICDQLEDPKLTKKLVKRGITELVTPGVVLGDNALEARQNNYLAAIHFGGAALGLALLDVSTGDFFVAEGEAEYIDKLLAGFGPKEILVERGHRDRLQAMFGPRYFTFELDDWAFNQASARQKVLKQLGVSHLKGFGVDHLHEAVTAAGACLAYLEITEHRNLAHIARLQRIEQENFVRLDKFTIRNLELVQAAAEDGRSLRQVIDRTLTPMGGRQLVRWLLFPLSQAEPIRRRQAAVEHFFRDPEFSELCEVELAKVGDLERLVSKLATRRINPREMQQLRATLETVVILKNACVHASDESIRALGERLAPCTELRQRIQQELCPEPPMAVGKGQVIMQGVSAELDDYRALSTSGKDYLLDMQQREVQRTGIQSLKIGYNNVFGYYMEVRNTYRDLVPPEWIRKQTLVSAERYITEELKEYENKILTAEDRILALETRLYGALVEAAAELVLPLQEDAHALADLDCFRSLADVARTNRYVRPAIDEGLTIDIRQGRHPVIETQMPAGEEYVANDVLLDSAQQQVIIVTGPNMAGKSALLRQTALITLLAQMGSFVPAESARIGLVDKIFTRVGASDNISAGESTFMVEMTEAANIMNNLTERSLVLFDELGRGTSTYDGISIAWSIVEALHEREGRHARTLFATHYHELNEMEALYQRVRNFNVSVREVDGRVVFLRKLQPGGSEHSFGIHVARLAGLPRSIVSRAEEVLAQLEQREKGSVRKTVGGQGETLGGQGKTIGGQEKTGGGVGNGGGGQLSFFQLDDPVLCDIRDRILGLDINALTPIEALNRLHDIQKILTGK
ncbi:MAG: DNA mismatch repair protein MutS [Bacteroidaceae bacterium]|nr:DNA mismatch repair protein MutS [Bacteroidaceae bacterium]